MFNSFIDLVRDIYNTSQDIPLHYPQFLGNEKRYVNEAIDSSYVSSIGEFVTAFEIAIARYIGAKHAIATVNGTAALHIALLMAGVEKEDKVLTQSFSFAATTNAIHYCNAQPVFIDIDRKSMSMCPKTLAEYLSDNCEVRDDGFCWHIESEKRVKACLPMHTFGFPGEIKQLSDICNNYNIDLVEDSAESLGSFSSGKHTGTYGLVSALSFNGNKIITTGGGGMIITDDDVLARNAKHMTTTSKKINHWNWEHDEVGYNYRMPNLNAALGLGQIELLDKYLVEKRLLAERYSNWFSDKSIKFFSERNDTTANYWLNVVLADDLEMRDSFLKETNAAGIQTRAAWVPSHALKFNQGFEKTDLSNTQWLYERLVNIPSSPVID